MKEKTAEQASSALYLDEWCSNKKGRAQRICDKVGISRSGISKMRSGLLRVSLPNALLMEKYFNSDGLTALFLLSNEQDIEAFLYAMRRNK